MRATLPERVRKRTLFGLLCTPRNWCRAQYTHVGKVTTTMDLPLDKIELLDWVGTNEEVSFNLMADGTWSL